MKKTLALALTMMLIFAGCSSAGDLPASTTSIMESSSEPSQLIEGSGLEIDAGHDEQEYEPVQVEFKDLIFQHSGKFTHTIDENKFDISFSGNHSTFYILALEGRPNFFDDLDSRFVDTFFDAQINMIEEDEAISVVSKEISEVMVTDEVSGRMAALVLSYPSTGIIMTAYVVGFDHGDSAYLFNYTNTTDVDDYSAEYLFIISTLQLV